METKRRDLCLATCRAGPGRRARREVWVESTEALINTRTWACSAVTRRDQVWQHSSPTGALTTASRSRLGRSIDRQRSGRGMGASCSLARSRPGPCSRVARKPGTRSALVALAPGTRQTRAGAHGTGTHPPVLPDCHCQSLNDGVRPPARAGGGRATTHEHGSRATARLPDAPDRINQARRPACCRSTATCNANPQPRRARTAASAWLVAWCDAVRQPSHTDATWSPTAPGRQRTRTWLLSEVGTLDSSLCRN